MLLFAHTLTACIARGWLSLFLLCAAFNGHHVTERAGVLAIKNLDERSTVEPVHHFDADADKVFQLLDLSGSDKVAANVGSCLDVVHERSQVVIVIGDDGETIEIDAVHVHNGIVSRHFIGIEPRRPVTAATARDEQRGKHRKTDGNKYSAHRSILSDSGSHCQSVNADSQAEFCISAIAGGV